MTAGGGAEPATPGPTFDLLWRTSWIYERRREKLAHAREALRLTFERRSARTPAIDELEGFLAREGSATDPDGMAVWSDPAAYHWVRTLYDLTAAVNGGADVSPAASAYLRDVGTEDPSEGLGLLVDEHKLFDVALALHRGSDLDLARPWTTSLSVAIPGMPRVLTAAAGAGVARIDGVRAGTVVGRHAEGVSPVSLQDRPVVTRDGVVLRLVPEAFDRPGMEMGAALRGLSAGYQDENAPWLQQALDSVARHHPVTLEHCRAMMQLVALKPADDDRVTNFSHSDFPGAMALSVVRHAEWLADSLIHEVHHSRLFYVEEAGRFFADETHNRMLDSSYYSPWREDLRPLHGILHAVYVHLPLWHFWQDVLRSSPASRDLASSRLAHVLLQLEIGVGQLRRHARFTPFGEEIFGEMAREVSELRVRATASGLCENVPAVRCESDGTLHTCEAPDGSTRTVRDLVAAHLRQFDVARQCGDAASI